MTPNPSVQHAHRQKKLLEAVAYGRVNDGNDHRRRIFVNLARLGLGRNEEALSDIAQLQETEPKDDCMFFRYGNMDALLRFGQLYSADLKDAVRDRLTAPPYRIGNGQTENHKIMIATAGILVGETWPEISHTAEDAAHCREYLLSYFDRITRYGQGEFDSPAYATFYLTSLATLRDGTRDQSLQETCERMLEWYLWQSAVEWLDGDMAGGHSRDYHSTGSLQGPSSALPVLWMYFGGREPNWEPTTAHHSVPCALCAFLPSEEILRAATDRSQPHEVRKSHDLIPTNWAQSQDDFETRSCHVSVHLNGWGYVSKVGIRKTTWMDKNFALGSFMDGREGDVSWTGQARRWSLDWVSSQQSPVFFCTHPFPDTHDPVNAERDKVKWLGSSPFEQVMQHRSTLLGVYRIPESGTYQYAPRQPFPAGSDPWIDGFHSANAILKWRLEGPNRLLCHGGSVLFAVTTSAPIVWVSEPQKEDETNGRWRCHGRLQAIAVEAVTPQQVGRVGATEDLETELDTWAAMLNEKAIFQPSLQGNAPALTYRDTAGHTLSIAYDGARCVDGLPLDLASWPLLETPTRRLELGSSQTP